MSDYVTKPVRLRHNQILLLSESDAETKYSRWGSHALVLAALAGLAWMTIGFLKPILMAGLFAATLYPFYLRLRSKIPSDGLRAGLLTAGFAVMFLLPIGAVAFLAANAGLKKMKDLPQDWTGQIQIESVLLRLESYLPFERAELIKHIEQAATVIGRFALSTLQGLVADLPRLMIVNVVILFGIFVLLYSAQPVLHWLKRLSPLSDSKTNRLFQRIGGLCSSSILATIVSGFVQALIIGIVLLFVSMPGGLLITMTAFVMSFLPIVGTAPVALYLIGTAAFAGNWSHVVIFVVTAGVVGVSDNIVRPYVLSDSAKLDGFIAFVAAVGALETMGFYGLFLGPVVAGAVFTLVELVQERRTA